MGNFLSCRAPVDGCDGKVVLSDGTVHEIDRPTTVAELMLEHPHQFVVDVRSLSAGGRSKPVLLPADHMLEPDKVYVMLPMARGNAAGLSAEEARRLIAMATQSMLRPRSASSFLGVLGARMAAGAAAERRREDPGDDDGGAKIGGLEWSSEAFEERPEFLVRQYSSKRWKPSLGTIEEKSLEKKVPHWLF